MYISAKDWNNYITKLSACSKTAAAKMKSWVQKNGFSDTDAMIDYAYALVTKYGEGAAALSAEMYDAIAEMQGKLYAPAVMADPPEHNEVGKAINGVLKSSRNTDAVSAPVDRLVKRTGADTILKNAIRDKAQFAWIPNGDTCAFCLTLASRGWQDISEKAMKNDHAEHIHANCDCTYAVRFDKKSGVQGYNPDMYREMYDSAEGNTPEEKINSMRRTQYAKNKDEINAKKREAYAARVEKQAVVKNPLLTSTNKNDKIISKMKKVYTYGHRNEKTLSDEQYTKAVEAARRQGYKGSIGYSEHLPTGILNLPTDDGIHDATNSLLVIGTDAYPIADARTANEMLTVDCCMAHEIIGHQGAWLRNTTQVDSVLEEVQASLRGSMFGVGLTDKERQLLRQDAMERLEKANIKYDDIKDQLDIKEK